MTLIRKPLLFLFVLATAASLAGGGRLSLRLLLDTATTLAIVPVIQIAALAVVYWTGRAPVGFATAVDAFFSGSAPWYAAAAVLGAFGAFASPVVAAEWSGPLVLAVAVVAAALSLRLDFTFLTSLLGRTRGRASVDLITHRVIAWTATIAYFILNSRPKLGSLLPGLAATLLGGRS